MPFTTALNTMKRFTDPVTRDVNNPWEAIQSRLSWMSENLPAARDVWGRERRPQEVYGRTYDIMVPVQVSERRPEPVDAELERLNVGIQRIQKKGHFDGADVNFYHWPKVYEEYVKLAGNELKHPAWNLGAMDLLNAVVSGKHELSEIYNLYSDGPEGGKASFIKNIVSEYRKMAQRDIMSRTDEFQDFIAAVEARKQQRRELKLPSGIELN